MNAPERQISLHPFGEPSGVSLHDLAAGITSVFGMKVTTGDWLPVPGGALDHRRRQYRSFVFLTALRERRDALRAGAGEAPYLLGITLEDIFVPSLNFVFGEADPRSGVAVISVHRLRPEFYGKEPDPDLLKERTFKEAVHELGHVFGLPHCPNPRCIMHFSNSIADTDFKGPEFCRECRARLAAAGIGRKSKPG